MLSPELLKILVCPACKGELDYQRERERLVCPGCRLAYAIKDDIPIMLIDEAERLEDPPTPPTTGPAGPESDE